MDALTLFAVIFFALVLEDLLWFVIASIYSAGEEEED